MDRWLSGGVVIALATAAACSSSSHGPHDATIASCTTTSYTGPSVSLHLTAQENAPKQLVGLGEEVIVAKIPNAGASELAPPVAARGAFCKRAEDASNWYLIAARRGTFTLTSFFPSTVGSNAAQSHPTAGLVVH